MLQLATDWPHARYYGDPKSRTSTSTPAHNVGTHSAIFRASALVDCESATPRSALFSPPSSREQEWDHYVPRLCRFGEETTSVHLTKIYVALQHEPTGVTRTGVGHWPQFMHTASTVNFQAAGLGWSESLSSQMRDELGSNSLAHAMAIGERTESLCSHAQRRES